MSRNPYKPARIENVKSSIGRLVKERCVPNDFFIYIYREALTAKITQKRAILSILESVMDACAKDESDKIEKDYAIQQVHQRFGELKKQSQHLIQMIRE